MQAHKVRFLPGGDAGGAFLRAAIEILRNLLPKGSNPAKLFHSVYK
jgi:hypothetical protein